MTVVHLVHCIDTEGPLYESLEETFKRLEHAFGITLPPSRETLTALQHGEVPLDGKEEAVARMLSPQLLDYHETWESLDGMLEVMLRDDYRTQYPDSFGQGWIYNWFCLDHLLYEENPRRRDMGYHRIFDHYRSLLDRLAATEAGCRRDGIHFHYHPKALTRQGHHSATHWFAHDDSLFQILARRILEREWFPMANRPGFHTNRPDSHWFLEQFIPFDYASQSHEQSVDQPDLGGYRFGEWSRAPLNWQPYHPHHDDYQKPGACRRWIFRCLNVGTRLRLLGQNEVNRAFREARENKPVVLAFTNHDFRDMRPDVAMVHEMLRSATRQFPDVQFRYCEAREAARMALNLTDEPACRLAVSMNEGLLIVESDSDIFGPQPFLALKRRDGAYFHDNLDIEVPFRRWSYVFDEQTIPLSQLEKAGVAACNAGGSVCVSTWDSATGRTSETVR